jgi:hypothetical protein
MSAGITADIAFFAVLVAATLGLYALIVIIRLGLQAFAVFVAVPCMVLTPWIGVHPQGSFTYGDLLLIMVVGSAGIAALGSPAIPSLGHSTKKIATACALMVVGSLIGMTVADADPTTSVSNTFAYSTAVTAALAFVFLLRPSSRQLRVLVGAYGFGVLISCLYAQIEPVTAVNGFRPSGLTTHPNHLGISGVLGAGMWMALLLAARKRTARVVHILGIAGVTWGVLISGSRAALVGVLVLFTATAIGSRSGWYIIAVLGALSAGAAAVAWGYVQFGETSALTRLLGQGSAREADLGRAEHYRVVTERIGEHMFTGVGFGDGRTGHSLYLQMWSIGGLLGLAAAAILVTTAIRSWKLAGDRRDGLAVGLWSGYLGYLVAAIGSNQMWDRYLWVALALALLADAKGSVTSAYATSGGDIRTNRPIERSMAEAASQGDDR